MNTLSFFFVLSVAVAGCVGSSIIQGPSSRSTVIGPDGSSITSFAPGGQVVTDHGPAALLAAPLTYAAPLAYTHHLAYSAPLAYAAAPLAYAAAPLVGRSSHTVVAGPSGTISHAASDSALVI
nr:unnamed protein product [Callosobruchus chinensis]